MKSKNILLIKKITNGNSLDYVGLLVVLIGSVSLGYHNTKIQFVFQKTEYYFPLGYFSILNVGFSMIATRLLTKKDNFGNLIHTFNTFLSGGIDYLLGNIGAILTYPISIFANYLSFKIWKKKKILNNIDTIFYRNLAIGMFLSLTLNYIAFRYLSNKTIDWLVYFSIALPAGLTFGGTFNNIRMYPDNWILWQIYNISKIMQSLVLLNIANTLKYIFYLINALLGYITWIDDKKLQKT
jgi:Nicotinamide mononucleotide transporter